MRTIICQKKEEKKKEREIISESETQWKGIWDAQIMKEIVSHYFFVHTKCPVRFQKPNRNHVVNPTNVLVVPTITTWDQTEHSNRGNEEQKKKGKRGGEGKEKENESKNKRNSWKIQHWPMFALMKQPNKEENHAIDYTQIYQRRKKERKHIISNILLMLVLLFVGFAMKHFSQTMHNWTAKRFFPHTNFYRCFVLCIIKLLVSMIPNWNPWGQTRTSQKKKKTRRKKLEWSHTIKTVFDPSPLPLSTSSDDFSLSLCSCICFS